jgi:molybdopterin/thiamine biosynthesis adenylyltransferase
VKPWHKRFPSIYTDNQSYWRDKGFDEAGAGNGIAFTGVITARVRGEHGLEHHPFKLRIKYPPGYPYIAPTVEFLDPQIKRARHQGVDGAPCLFPPAAWTLNFPASEIYAATERWLGYHVAGRFPRELALYELPEYFGWTPFTVIASPVVFERIADKHLGRFSIDELVGQDLGVLWTVDEQEIGRELEDAVAPPRVRKRDRHQGRWYRLNHEPPLMNNSVELERVLKRSGHQVNLSKRPREKELIALVFSDAALGEERLLLLDIGVASKKATPDIGKGWLVRAPQLYIVSHDELFRRLEGVRDVDRLQDKRVACVGLGAIGSPLAIALTREGLGSFALCDPDTLRPGNLVRHALDLLSVGQFKAEAVDAALSRINPTVDSVLEMENLSHPDVLATMIRGADLVVAAIGNDLKEELLCEVVVRSDEQPPMLLVRTLHAGAAFRVALIRPGRDACVTCLADYRTDRHPDWIDVPADNLPDVFDAGCAAAARPGAGLSSQQAAVFAASRALEVLEDRASDTNHWVWIERPIAGVDVRLDKALTLHQARFAPRPGCPTCGCSST